MVNMREPFLREDLEAGEENKERKGLRGCGDWYRFRRPTPFIICFFFYFLVTFFFFFLFIFFFFFFCNVGLLGFLVMGRSLGFRVAAS